MVEKLVSKSGLETFHVDSDKVNRVTPASFYIVYNLSILHHSFSQFLHDLYANQFSCMYFVIGPNI